MKKAAPTARERLNRMRELFAKYYCILAEDYEFFTQPQDAATPLSTDSRTSAGRSVRKCPRRS